MWFHSFSGGSTLLWRRAEGWPHQWPWPLWSLPPACWALQPGGKWPALRRRRRLQWCRLFASLKLRYIAALVLHVVSLVEIEVFVLGYGVCENLFHFLVMYLPTGSSLGSGGCSLLPLTPNTPGNRQHKLLNIILCDSPHRFHPSTPETCSWARSAARTFNSVHERWCNLWPFSRTILLIILDFVGKPRRIICLCNI